MEVEKRYKISEAANILDVKDQFVRNLEKYVGLTFPVDEDKVKFITENDIEDIKEVIRLKEEKGLPYKAIRKVFLEEGRLEASESNALEVTTLDQMTPRDLKKTMDKMFMEIVIKREEELEKAFEKKLEEERSKIAEEVTQKITTELMDKMKEQREAENQKLLEAIEKTREKKGFLGKFFR